MKSLADIAVGGGGVVRYAEGRLSQRLYDLGFNRGAEVKCLFAAPGRGMRAYLARGAVIALRERDARRVVMEENEHA
ncbi:MAG: ferrous iron transport protein A [Clostridia bacterium]|nr:ferrous iron transport protein A [Clostridia bacterium]